MQCFNVRIIIEEIMHWKTAGPDRYKLLKSFAKENRRDMTEAESILWTSVKGNALGHKFLRQYIIGDYIVDFYCRDAQVVVEIDGGYHRSSKFPCIRGLQGNQNYSSERRPPNDLLLLLQENKKSHPSWLDPTRNQEEEDRIRQEWLESQGYAVIRFTNEEVVCDIDNTLFKLKKFIDERYTRK